MAKSTVHRQFAALPFQSGLHRPPMVLVITSRDTGRWIIPKGWPMKGKKPHEAAAQEAWEEAGVLGRISRRRIGRYEYDKRADDGSTRRCQVDVFPLLVETMDVVWPEFGERRRRWMLTEEAAGMVDEEGLSDILQEFSPGKRLGEKAEPS